MYCTQISLRGFWTQVILNTNKRMTRIFFGTRISSITRMLVHVGMLTVFWTRTTRIKRIYLAHGSHADACSRWDAHMRIIERERHEWDKNGFDTGFCEHTLPSFGTGNKIFLYFFSARQSESKLSLFSLIEKVPNLHCWT